MLKTPSSLHKMAYLNMALSSFPFPQGTLQVPLRVASSLPLRSSRPTRSCIYYKESSQYTSALFIRERLKQTYAHHLPKSDINVVRPYVCKWCDSLGRVCLILGSPFSPRKSRHSTDNGSGKKEMSFDSSPAPCRLMGLWTKGQQHLFLGYYGHNGENARFWQFRLCVVRWWGMEWSMYII